MLTLCDHIDFEESATILIEADLFSPVIANLRDRIPKELQFEHVDNESPYDKA